MNPVADLTQAWRGWGEIGAGRASAARNFTPGLPGLIVALMWFLVAVLLSTAVQSIGVGMPSAEQVLIGLAIQAITLAALAVVIWQTMKFLRIAIPLTELLIPIVYAMALMFVVAIPLTLAGPNVALIAVFGLALLIWRAGRVLANMGHGVAVAFALLCLMVLVVAPNALYILFLQLPSSA